MERKSLLLSVILWVCVLPMMAQQVTKEQALEKARVFFGNPKTEANKLKAPRKSPQLQLAIDSEELYLFNDLANKGYVIISGDERTPEVLAYSYDGFIDSNDMPCNLKAVIDDYAGQIAWLKTHPDYQLPSSSNISTTAVQPLLGETAWAQDSPYNEMCPTIAGQHCKTGCVATAAAQVMYYHKWPERGTGSISYAWNGQTLSADFSQSVYRWDLMTPTYYSDSSKESCDAVALLMRDIGYACKTNYTRNGSGAGEHGKSLIKYFDYDKSMGYIARNKCDEESWHNIILEDLHNGLPVLYTGGSSGGAHALVVDGYDGNGGYHFNFGWGSGGNNGYYTMLSIVYNMAPSIYFGVKKNEGGNPRYTFCSPDDFIYNEEKDYLYVQSSFFCPGDENPVYVGALAVENLATHDIMYVGEREWAYIFYLYYVDLPDGNYILYPVAREKGKDQWQKYYFRDGRQTFVDLNVTNGVKTYANNHLYNGIQEGAVEIDGIYYILDDTKHEATVTFKNDKYYSYSGDVTIPNEVSYNDKEYKVTEVGKDAFYGCNMGTLRIAKSIKSLKGFFLATLDRLLFEQDAELETIGMSTFIYTTFKSMELNLPDKLNSLGYHAFESSSFVRLSVPSSVSNLDNVFNDNAFFRTLMLHWDTPLTLKSSPFNHADMSLFTIYVPKGTVDLYRQAEVWKDCGHIVEIGDTVTINGFKYMLHNDNTATLLSAFDVKLSTCVIPSTLSYQGKRYIVRQTGPFAFMFSGVTDVTIPADVTYFDEGAFYDYNSDHIRTLRLCHHDPPQVADHTNKDKKGFYSLFETSPEVVYVPAGCKSKYQADSFWGQFNIVEDVNLRIDDVSAASHDDNKNSIYSISGMEIRQKENRKLPKGIYIQGNKKIVRR